MHLHTDLPPLVTELLVGSDAEARSATEFPYFFEGISAPMTRALASFLAGPSAAKASRAEPPLSQELAAIAALQPGWDGYGANRISPEAIVATRRIASLLPEVGASTLDGSAFPLPEVTPNPNGTISLIWESAIGDAHLEIGKTKFSFFVRVQGDAPILGDGLIEYLDSSIVQMAHETLFEPAEANNTVYIEFAS